MRGTRELGLLDERTAVQRLRAEGEAQGGMAAPSAATAPKADGVCKICGASIRSDRKYCGSCAPNFQGEQIREAAKSAGTLAAHSAEARATVLQSRRRHAAAMSAWDPTTLPDWLNADGFVQKIQPMLADVTTSAISTALGVSWVYASHIRTGLKRPHPRHWVKLAELVGVSQGD